MCISRDVLWRVSTFNKIGLEAGAKQIIKNYAQEVLGIPFSEGLIDLDTPKDYEQLLAENQQHTAVQI